MKKKEVVLTLQCEICKKEIEVTDISNVMCEDCFEPMRLIRTAVKYKEG